MSSTFDERILAIGKTLPEENRNTKDVNLQVFMQNVPFWTDYTSCGHFKRTLVDQVYRLNPKEKKNGQTDEEVHFQSIDMQDTNEEFFGGSYSGPNTFYFLL